MSWIEIIFIYILIWWLVVFAVLPFGIRHATQPEAGHPAGAPERPRVWLKLVVTTLLSAVVTAIVIYAMSIIGSPGAWAQENPCGALPDYRPDPSVEYKAGMDEMVAPADLYPPALSEDDFQRIEIYPALPLEPYLDTSKYNVDLSDTRVSPGVISIEEGQAVMNGRSLGAPGSALPCK